MPSAGAEHRPNKPALHHEQTGGIEKPGPRSQGVLAQPPKNPWLCLDQDSLCTSRAHVMKVSEVENRLSLQQGALPPPGWGLGAKSTFSTAPSLWAPGHSHHYCRVNEVHILEGRLSGLREVTA